LKKNQKIIVYCGIGGTIEVPNCILVCLANIVMTGILTKVFRGTNFIDLV
jgi:hypothetical protein